MNTPTATNNVLLRTCMRLRRTINVVAFLNLVFIPILLTENIKFLKEAMAGWIGYALLISFLVLIILIIFLCYRYKVSLPKDEEEVFANKRPLIRTPIALFVLLSIQIAIIGVEYIAAHNGWLIFKTFPLLYLLSPDAYPAILLFFLQIAIIVYEIRFILQAGKLTQLCQHNHSKGEIQKQHNLYGKLLNIAGIITTTSILLYFVYSLFIQIKNFQYLDLVFYNPITFKEIFFILNFLLITVLCIALSQRFHVNEYPKFRRLSKRLTLFMSLNLGYYLIVCIPKEFIFNRYLFFLVALIAVFSQISLMYILFRIGAIKEKEDYAETLNKKLEVKQET